MLNTRYDSLAGRLLRLPLRLLPERAVMPVLSGINRGCRWRVGSSIHRCWLGYYESDKQRLLAALAKPGMVAYDVGANAGFYTLALSHLVGPGGRVHAFEPLPENAANVRDHLQLNACGNVVLHQVAVSDRDGHASFHVAASNAMGHLADDGTCRVPTARIDTLIGAGDLPQPDIVKMDVEGAESRVLEGARQLLAQGRTIWLIALHGQEQREQVARILTETGHRLLRLDGSVIDDGRVDTDEIYALPAAAGR